MGVIYAPETEYAKERQRWEAQGSEVGPGLRPYVFKPYPAMMFKAGRPENGLGAHCIVETRIAASEKDEANWFSSGFRSTPQEAIEYVDNQQVEFARLAAELNHEQKNKLSERASAEVDQARAEHAGDISRHMPSVPVTPIKKRGRKVKES